MADIFLDRAAEAIADNLKSIGGLKNTTLPSTVIDKIAFATILVSYNVLFVNAGKYVVVVPKQIRRSPALPPRNLQATASASYPQHSIAVNPYGPIKPGASFPTNNQIPHGANEIAPSQNGPNYPALPYGKGPVYYPYPYSAKIHPPYAKYKGGFVPLTNQNRYVDRYPVEINRPRPQGAPIYHGTLPPSNYYPSRPISNDPYHVNKNSPTRLQPIDRPQPIFTGQQRPFVGNPEDPVKNTQQSATASPFPSTVNAIVVKAAPNLQQEATRNGDLVKDSSNVVGKVPPASTNGATTGQFIIRDTVMLDDYEKKIAEFTQSWPKLSSFPGAYSSASSLFPASSYDPTGSTGVSRSSDVLGTVNTSSRKGYEVKEDVDEPEPFDYRPLPIVGSQLNQYSSGATTALTKNLFVSN